MCIPLPVSAYFDETIQKYEIEILFKNRPSYIGHSLMVPQKGDYFALSTEKESRLIIHNYKGEISLLSNICKHRQAIMLKGSNNIKNIICPIHNWTYDLDGKLLGAPHFKNKPCANLQKTPLVNWHGLLFDSKNIENIQSNLTNLSKIQYFNFNNYKFDHIEIHECPYNWKTFIEVYLEDYHIIPFHPGLSSLITCSDLKWEFGEYCSLQTVGLQNELKITSSLVYRKLYKEIVRLQGSNLPKFGAIWLLYYPNLMLEWYPNVLVISWLIPRTPQHTTNIIEFYYPSNVVLFERRYIEAKYAAYMETLREDDEIALRMDTGRLALLERGENDMGPYQEPMEDGIKHFHKYLRKKLGSILSDLNN